MAKHPQGAGLPPPRVLIVLRLRNCDLEVTAVNFWYLKCPLAHAHRWVVFTYTEFASNFFFFLILLHQHAP